MNIENTFVMLKPDCIQRGLIGEVISRIEGKGYQILKAKMTNLDSKFLYAHYAHISDRPFFKEVLEYMMSGPVLGLCVSGENAVLGVRLLVGATKFEEALPGTIRGDFALSTSKNMIHASDSVDNGEIEINRFFSL